MAEDINQAWKLRKEDFVPFVGLFNYQDRWRKNKSRDKKNSSKYDIRMDLLAIYQVPYYALALGGFSGGLLLLIEKLESLS